MVCVTALGFVAVPIVWYIMRAKHFFCASTAIVALVFASFYLIPYAIYGPRKYDFLGPLLLAVFGLGILAVLVGTRLYGAKLSNIG